MQKKYVEEYIKVCLKKTLNQTYSSASCTTLLPLILKRINSQLSFDPFFSQEFHKEYSDHDHDCVPATDYLNNFVSNYLSPSLKSLGDPFLMNDMDRAVERITKALTDDENICIYGDYDVDGITSTSFLVSFLREIKKLLKPNQTENTIFYKLPDRIKDGYGLGIGPINEICDTVRQNSNQPLTLMITVDLGITNVEEVSYANSKNIDTIICDHHEVPLAKSVSEDDDNDYNEILPNAYAILNPKRRNDKFNFKFLPGVGIAFNLGIAIRKRLVTNGSITTYPNLKNYLDIVCLGIIADIVPMYGDNRTLTYHGLHKINNNPRPGIRELKRICGLHFDNVNESDIAWKIAPKINATGRVGNPAAAVELLTENNPERAYELAQQLNAVNKKRQMLEDICFNDTMNQINERNLTESDAPILILSGELWHPGVIGIVSSKLVDYLQKPVLLLSGYKEGVYIGSVRSYDSIDIYTFLKHYESFYEKFGGHKMACGLTIKKGRNFDDFISATSKDLVDLNIKLDVNSEASHLNNPDGEHGKIPDYDEEIDLNAAAKKDLSNLIKLMSPYGPLNEQPKFLIRNITLLNINKREYKNKNINSKKNGLFNCYFTFNIKGSSNDSNVKPKAFLFKKYKTMKNIFDAESKDKIDVDGIIFEFFNGYIKILNFI